MPSRHSQSLGVTGSLVKGTKCPLGLGTEAVQVAVLQLALVHTVCNQGVVDIQLGNLAVDFADDKVALALQQKLNGTHAHLGGGVAVTHGGAAAAHDVAETGKAAFDTRQRLNLLGEKVELLARNRFGNVAQGFVSASLLFCVGSMTVVGAMNSGLLCDHTMLYTKAMLDFVSSMILATSMGIGVLLSASFVFVFQGSITLLAQWIAPFLTTEVITCMTGVGSILIIGLALNVLGVTKLKITNYVPAILLPAFLIPIADWLATLV